MSSLVTVDRPSQCKSIFTVAVRRQLVAAMVNHTVPGQQLGDGERAEAAGKGVEVASFLSSTDVSGVVIKCAIGAQSLAFGREWLYPRGKSAFTAE